MVYFQVTLLSSAKNKSLLYMLGNLSILTNRFYFHWAYLHGPQ
jgi:hypothetical protein